MMRRGFVDRVDAGKQLAKWLTDFKNKPDTIVLGLPRGGVPVAYEVAKELNAPLDIVCPRKVGAPGHEEFAIGAVMEDGKGYFNQDVIRHYGIPQEYIKKQTEKQVAEANRRLREYRSGRPYPNLAGKNIILVDDGIATGATMRAAIQSLKSRSPGRLVIAVPVGPGDTLKELSPQVDKVVCPLTPYPFNAVGLFYQDFSQTEDNEVIDLLNKAATEIGPAHAP